MSKPYAQVIVPRPVRSLFTYHAPDLLSADATPGKRALVPFGAKKLIGLIVARTETSDIDTKPILQVIDPEPVVSDKMIKLALWTAEYYFAPPGAVAALILPRDDGKLENIVELTGAEPPNTRSKMAQDIYDALQGKGGMRKLDLLAKDLGITVTKLKQVLAGQTVKNFTNRRQAWRLISKRKIDTDEKAITKPARVKLTDQQKAAERMVADDIDKDSFQVSLIHGVTGSGKTEIYASLARKVFDNGKSVLALAPEIALCNLLAERLEKRLDAEVTVIHSDLKPRERAIRWEKIRSGEARVVVGARSALFAPLDDLGLIIVDEEHDPAYKQEEAPRYHGRDLAVMRGSLENVPVLLGSATPAMESYHNAVTGKYRLIELTERIEKREMPRVEIETPEPNSKLGARLMEEIEARLEKKEQSLIFLNRRGSARYIQCQRCGHVYECRNCSLSLVYHSDSAALKCHTCGYREPAPDKCPECAEGELYEGGTGTQSVAGELSQLFPSAKVVRMDRDTTAKRDSSRRILDGMETGGTDILVGTQMITKGHDYPGITFVGVISADDALHIPDFRAGERTFQQITQSAGRAGRGDKGGLVMVQTHSSNHHSVETAIQHDYKSFYNTEIKVRELAGYPPFKRLALIRIDSGSKTGGERFVEKVAQAIKHVQANNKRVEVFGPVEAVVFKARNRYRWRILIKAPDPVSLSKGIRQFLSRAELIQGGGGGAVRISVDVDPVDVM